ncbi:Toll/interleukin-1 receptor domain-containing protein [Tanacetum coccineum]
MECRKGFGHTAYPVFYDVEPTEVRKQSGSVGDAFAKLNKEDEAARKWREALKEASDLVGFELKSIANGHEAKFIQKIVEEISLELRFINSSIDGNLIGMDTRVNEVISFLEPGVGDVRMLGIWGMGGAGKTTLARAVFDQISFQFEGKSFVENVREESKPSLSDLKSLQKQVLSDILNDQGFTVSGVLDGKNKMKKTMRGRKVLVVLDDVDHKDQLETLAGDRNWLKPGKAGCLFSRYAFGRENPIQGYEELSGKVLQYADGLPLTIKVMGSFLCGQDESEWKDAIKRLGTIPLKKTMEVLELSYNGLEEDCKEIFLDVACILKGWDKDDAIRALESRGFCEEMGRNIVRRSQPDEPNKHSRLWIRKEIEYILTNDPATQATKCLKLESFDCIAEIAMKRLTNMKDLKVLDILIGVECNGNSNCINWKFDKVSQYLPCSLRFMRWNGFPFSSFPNTFRGENLVGLEIEDSNIVQFWEDGEEKVLNNLRFFTISHSKLKTFDLSLAPNLEQLTIDHCKDLVELHIPVDDHSKLQYLTLTNSKLTNLHLGNTPNLNKLTLQSCGNLVELQMPAESLNLKYLNINYSELTNIHLGNTPNLNTLKLRGYNMVEFQMPAESLKLERLDLSYSWLTNLHLENTPNLKKLKLIDCYDLVEFQMPAESLKLEHLDLSHSKLTNFHLGNTPNLKILVLAGCNDLVEFLMPAPSLKLEHLDLSHSKLTNLHLGNTPNLKILVLAGCNDLVEFLMPAPSLKLEHLDLSHSKLTNLHLGNTPNLKNLKLEGCNAMVEFQMPAESLKLEHLDLSHSKLKTIHLGSTPNLEKLILKGCNDLVELEVPSECLKLEDLYLSHSKLRYLYLGNTPKLECLILEGCNDLVEFQMPAEKLQMPDESLNLVYLDLSHSKLKTIHLGSTPNLEKLILKGCNDLVKLQMPDESLNLEYLDLSHSKLMTVHLVSNLNLKALTLEGCNELVELQMPTESLNLEYLYLSHSKTIHLGNTPNILTLILKNCHDLAQLYLPGEILKLVSLDLKINAPVGCLKRLVFLDLSGSGRFKSFWSDKQLDKHHDSLSELHLIAEPIDVCPLHSDNDFPKFKFSCYYKEGQASSFGNLERLISVGLCACTNLEIFFGSLCSLQCVRKLTLEGSIPEAPKNLDQLECLEELTLSSTKIEILPDRICMSRHLKRLEIISCWYLEKLPEDIGQLECLETLILMECILLRDIPNSICNISSLKHLRLRFCIGIDTLPEDIGRLECLRELNISRTGISYLPRSIFQLKGLCIVTSSETSEYDVWTYRRE